MVETGTQTTSDNTMDKTGTQAPTTVIVLAVKKNHWMQRSMGLYQQLVQEQEEEGSDQAAGPSARKQEEEVREMTSPETWADFKICRNVTATSQANRLLPLPLKRASNM